VYPLAFADGKIWAAFFQSLMGILAPDRYYIASELGNAKICIDQSANCRFPIDANRNEHVQYTLDTMKPDYLMFLDGDMTHPADTILRLLSCQKDIISGLYHFGGGNFWPVALRHKGDPTGQDYQPVQLYDDKPFWVDAIGMGCALIKADVFRNIPSPWFEYTNDNATGLRARSEDMKFCESARGAGYEIWVDPMVKCGHIKNVIVGEDDYTPYRDGIIHRINRLREKDDQTEYEQFTAQIIDVRSNGNGRG
jgi:hypothetical protein